MKSTDREVEVKENREIIKKMIKVLTHSIYTDEDEVLPREPLGRSDTYWMRNTLQSMLDGGLI